MSSSSAEATSTQPIVVGVDGSEPSKVALRWAAFMAETFDCPVHAVSAWQTPLQWGGAGYVVPPSDWNPAGTAAAILDKTIADVFGDTPPAGLQTLVREGGAARVLLQAAEGARMIVVGSRGHGGFAGLLLGSVSTACAEHASCPVLVLHGSSAPARED